LPVFVTLAHIGLGFFCQKAVSRVLLGRLWLLLAIGGRG
jgi:hypothetical protein